MSRTRHMQQRMSQRGISEQMLKMVETFGIRKGDKVTLSEKGCRKVSEMLASLKRTIDTMAEKGGYVLVELDGLEITAYRMDSFSMPKSRVEASMLW